MATIASLAVSLTARTGSFEKGLARAKKVSRRFSRDLTRHTKRIAGYGAAIVGVAAGALTVLVKGQLAAVDSTSKMARTLGLATEELVGWQHAAKFANVDSDSLTKGIVRFNRTIADAQAGLSTAQRELERVGLSAEALAGMSTDQRLKVIADRYNSIGDAADRSSFLMNVFGRSGLGLGNLFEQGAEGIAKAQQEAEDLGLTFSAIDGASIERANDAVSRTADAVTGLSRRIAVQLAPFLEVISVRVLEFAKNVNLSGDVVENVVGSWLRGFGKVADYIELLKGFWYSFVAGVSATAWALISPIRQFVNQITILLNLLNIRVANKLYVLVNSVSKGYADQAVEAAEKAITAFDRFQNGFNQNKAHDFFEAIKIEAEKASEAVGGLMVPDVDDLEGASSSTAKSTFARQVDLSRVSIGGFSASKDKPVTKGQGQDMVTQLKAIARNTAGGRVLIT